MKKSILLFSFILLLISGCTYDKAIPSPETGNYPTEVANIILTKCATPGCHNDQSKAGADGLSLTSWDHLFEGTNNGATVIPFNPDQSTLLQFTNTYQEFGVSLPPTMPLNLPPLSRSEIKILRDWILQGAPDKNNFVKFSDNPQRRKIYVTNQGCDLVDVIDANTGLIMRAVNVGADPGVIESPHMVRVSPDRKKWFTVFYNGSVLQQFNAENDQPEKSYNIGPGRWNTVALSADNRWAYAVDWSADGKVAIVDLQNETIRLIQGSGLLIYPHGITISPSGKTLYVTGQTGNFIYKIDVSNPDFPDIEQVSMENGQPVKNVSSLDPHDIIFSADGMFYYVSCQKSNEVRMVSTANDSIVKIIPTGFYPQEFAVSQKHNYLFISCPEDTLNASPDYKGVITVIDRNTNNVVQNIKGEFYQPHGLGVDELSDVLNVSNRNISIKGPAPHHSSICGGRNGFLNTVLINSLIVQPKRTELSVDPYSVSVRN